MIVSGGALRARLRHVGARPLAHVEARLRGAHLLIEKGEILRAKSGDRTVLDHIHVGAGGIGKDVLFSVAQVLALRQHLRFCRSHVVACLKSIEQALVDRDADRTGAQALPRIAV